MYYCIEQYHLLQNIIWQCLNIINEQNSGRWAHKLFFFSFWNCNKWVFEIKQLGNTMKVWTVTFYSCCVSRCMYNLHLLQCSILGCVVNIFCVCEKVYKFYLWVLLLVISRNLQVGLKNDYKFNLKKCTEKNVPKDSP